MSSHYPDLTTSISFLNEVYQAASKEIESKSLEVGKLVNIVQPKAVAYLGKSRDAPPASSGHETLIAQRVASLFQYVGPQTTQLETREILAHFTVILRDASEEKGLTEEQIKKLKALGEALAQIAETQKLPTIQTDLQASLARLSHPAQATEAAKAEKMAEEVLTHDPSKFLTELGAARSKESLLQRIGIQTRDYYHAGAYLCNDRKVLLDSKTLQRSQDSSKIIPKFDPIPANKETRKAKTEIEVVNADTVSAAYALFAEDRSHKIAVLSMANPGRPGGSFVDGGTAQEEDLCRCSTLFHAIGENPQLTDRGLYRTPIPKPGLIFSPEVQFFRGPRKDGYPYLDSPRKFDVVSAPGFDLRAEKVSKNDYEKVTKEIIRNILRSAASNGDKYLILGALGCGAFAGFPPDPKHPSRVAGFFKDVLKDKEFEGVFTKVVFAVLDPEKGPNITAFTKAFPKKK